MRSLKIVLLATVAAAAFTTATMAADPIVMVDTPAPMAAATGWDGPYAGLFVLGSSAPGTFGVGVDVGVNLSTDGIFFGIEGDAALLATATYDVQVHAKVGVMAADQAAVFGLIGVGYSSAAGHGTYVPVGIGAEFGIADNTSIAASVEYDWNTGGGVSPVVGKVGVNFHF